MSGPIGGGPENGLPSLGYAVISAREIYDAIVRLTGRVDVLIEGHSNLTSDVGDHETRIRTLERARWPLPSLAALTAILSLGVTGWTVIHGGG